MASKEVSTFYTHQTNLRDISQPMSILQPLFKPLVLRIPQEKDLQPLIDVLANPVNTKNDLSVASSTPQERESVCRQWLNINEPLNHLNFAVIHTANDQEEVLGIAGLGWIGPAKTENNKNSDGSARAGAAGVMVNPAARRKGIGSEALKMVIDYGLNVLGLIEVRIGTPSSNTAMRRVMEVRFQMQPDDNEEKSDRFGNDLLWRINKERWLRYLEQE
ncbi:hypothetical protein EYB26_000448 [Talaromyces marneffei]|uniref:uncharacterized protein n=1 Tax=Talaromyces marneffei TaxID=37727 RepID=UPI0012A9D2AA|nr:uncharacterized protein EYB26_000448 [Talaromyces marneffei]QGA12803.1 hypothetical protein EYB26_000448 [Talaromyces marneffei]